MTKSWRHLKGKGKGMLWKKVLGSVPLNWQRIIFNIIPPKAEETSTWVKHERNLVFGFAKSIPANFFATTGFAKWFREMSKILPKWAEPALYRRNGMFSPEPNFTENGAKLCCLRLNEQNHVNWFCVCEILKFFCRKTVVAKLPLMLDLLRA